MVGFLKCANCGEKIEPNKMYYQCKDNFLLSKYFDCAEQSVFCSQECFCAWCSLDLEFNEQEVDL